MSHIVEKPKKIPFRLIKRFLQTKSFKKIHGVPFVRIRKFSQKSRIVSKKPTGGTFWSPLYFWKHTKMLLFSARLEPTLSFFLDPRKLAGQKVEQMNKQSVLIALN